MAASAYTATSLRLGASSPLPGAPSGLPHAGSLAVSATTPVKWYGERGTDVSRRTDGAISGTVRDTAGPLTNARVALYYRATNQLISRTRTDAAGRYRFLALDPDDFQRFVVVAHHPIASDVNAQVLDLLTPVAATSLLVDVPSMGNSATYGTAALEIVIHAQTAEPGGISAFVPPSTLAVHRGDILWHFVTMLYNFDEATVSGWVMPTGHSDVATSTTGTVYLTLDQSRYGTSSVLYDGWQSYVNDPYNAAQPTNTGHAFVFHTGDFTIESWMYPTAGAGASRTLLGKFSSWPNGLDFSYEIEGGAGKAAFWMPATQTTYHELAGYTDLPTGSFAKTPTPVMSDAAIPLNTWTHVAVCRRNRVTTMYINGVAQSAPYTEPDVVVDTVTINPGDKIYGSTYSGPTTAAQRLTYPPGSVFIENCYSSLPIGGGFGGANRFYGYVNGLRITACARYDGSTFTPPTTPYRGW